MGNFLIQKRVRLPPCLFIQPSAKVFQRASLLPISHLPASSSSSSSASIQNLAPKPGRRSGSRRGSKSGERRRRWRCCEEGFIKQWMKARWKWLGWEMLMNNWLDLWRELPEETEQTRYLFLQLTTPSFGFHDDKSTVPLNPAHAIYTHRGTVVLFQYVDSPHTLLLSDMRMNVSISV